MTNTMKLRRGEKIKLTLTNTNTYEVTNREGEKVLSADQDWCIYLSDINFGEGYIEGRYLGDTTEESVLFDRHARDVVYLDKQFWINNGEAVKTARMLAISNKRRTVVVIEDR